MSWNNDSFISHFFDAPGDRLNRFGEDRRHGNLLMDEYALFSYGYHFPMAVETHFGQYILNGDSYSTTTSGHQNATRRKVPAEVVFAEIPFSALATLFEVDGAVSGWRSDGRVGFVRQVKILDTEDAKYITIKYRDPKTGECKERQEHMLGASLVRFNGRYLLSGTDAGAYWRFGYFMSELPGECVTVEEAFEMLKPDEVKQAERDGKNWHRQGEWFFIEQGKSYAFRGKLREVALQHFPEPHPRLPGMPTTPRTFSINQFVQKQYKLPAHGALQVTGHHYARDTIIAPDGFVYVRGSVRHDNNEHRMLMLGETWWLAVPNRQVQAWGASGRID